MGRDPATCAGTGLLRECWHWAFVALGLGFSGLGSRLHIINRSCIEASRFVFVGLFEHVGSHTPASTLNRAPPGNTLGFPRVVEGLLA